MNKRIGAVVVTLLLVVLASQAGFAAGFGGGRGAGARGGNGLAVEANEPGYQIVADALGMSTDELRAARIDGKSVTQMAEEKGISQEQLENSITNERKAALDEAVAAGKLTQDQADQYLDVIKSKVGQYCDQTQTRVPLGRGAAGGNQSPGGARGFRGGR